MRTRASTLVAIASLCWGTACAAPVDVARSPGTDLSRFHSWSWDPAGLEVEAGADSASLRAAVARVVERAMAARGFTRDDRAPDLRVQARVSVRRRVGVVRVPMAPNLVNSMNASASYLVEGSTLERRLFEDLRLGIGIRLPGGPLIWRATTGYSVELLEGRDLEQGILRLVDHIPPSASGSEGVPLPGPDPSTPEHPERLADTGARPPAR